MSEIVTAQVQDRTIDANEKHFKQTFFKGLYFSQNINNDYYLSNSV